MAFSRLVDIGIVGAINSSLLLVILVRMVVGRRTRPPARTDSAGTVTAPRADAVLVAATASMVIYYLVFGAWVIRPSLAGPYLADPRPWSASVGIVLALLSTALIVWAFTVFASWRLRAEIDENHELMTEGPFGLVRHPIYTGLVGVYASTLFVVPTVGFLIAVVLIAVVHDYRARTEEGVLRSVFGNRYTSYIGHTKRFVPGVY
ncbi:methyltransferase family protein [Nocardia crassostreae]|uniref:methyltransferase family protein n=1 Tax=Nocardia crassostreae TaxID=53428 RepID=UPI000833AF24|nr:isoprenylcysteine carboxylmethyltransferase family protein [Nocardia crassostreae]